MAEENQVMKEPQGEAAQLPSGVQPAQQRTKEPQRVTTKNPKKVEAGKRLAESNRKSKPILWNWSCLSSGSYRWSWLLHLSNQERRATTTK